MRLFDIKSLSEVVFDSGRDLEADVAIVIPLYNYECYILDCLKSVLDQTIQPMRGRTSPQTSLVTTHPVSVRHASFGTSETWAFLCRGIVASSGLENRCSSC
jgi:hypothetical protein